MDHETLLIVDDDEGIRSQLALAFEGGSIVWTSTAAYAGLTAQQKLDLKNDVLDAMESVDEISTVLFPGEDQNAIDSVIGDLDSFFDSEL